MQWLESHVWLATWLALIVGIAGLIIQNAKTRFTNIDWPRTMIYIGFLTALAVAFSPIFDDKARTVADTVMAITLGAIIVQPRRS